MGWEGAWADKLKIVKVHTTAQCGARPMRIFFMPEFYFI